MPNANTHDRVGAVVAVLAIPSTQYITQTYDRIQLPFHDSLFLAAMVILTTYYLSPDLDLISTPYYRWGRLKFLWLPYQRIIKHRSWLSHSGPISFTLRLGYVLSPLLALWAMFPLPLPDYAIYYLALFWLAGCISDTVHCILDWVT